MVIYISVQPNHILPLFFFLHIFPSLPPTQHSYKCFLNDQCTFSLVQSSSPYLNLFIIYLSLAILVQPIIAILSLSSYLVQSPLKTNSLSYHYVVQNHVSSSYLHFYCHYKLLISTNLIPLPMSPIFYLLILFFLNYITFYQLYFLVSSVLIYLYHYQFSQSFHFPYLSLFLSCFFPLLFSNYQ